MRSELLPDGYLNLLNQVKADAVATRQLPMRMANGELIGLCWRIGRLILDRQQVGTRVIERLAVGLLTWGQVTVLDARSRILLPGICHAWHLFDGFE